MNLLKVLLFFLSLISTSHQFNYLVFCPLFAHSHHVFLAKIADTLTDAGHNVTFLAPIIFRRYENVKYLKSTKDLVLIQPSEELAKFSVVGNYSKFWTHDASAIQFAPAVRGYMKMFYQMNEDFKNNLRILDELKDRKFDAMIFQFMSYTAFPIADYLNIKTLLPVLSMTHEVTLSRWIGEPASPSILPGTIAPYGDDMSFSERLHNTMTELYYKFFVPPEPMCSFKEAERVIDVEGMTRRAPFVFLNANPYLDFPRALLTKSVWIGGITVNTTQIREQKLPKEFDEILGKRQKNVLISFGSQIMAKDMPWSYKETLLAVISSFKNVTFIWKYEEEDLKVPENLHVSKWVPQTTLLADSRLSAFITHAGLGSIQELSYLGKPAILIPVFGDQMRNSRTLARHNGSIVLNKYELKDFQKVKSAVERILSDQSYSKNAEILAQHLHDQPISPQQLLVRHAEFGAKYGELKTLDPSSRSMSWFSFYMIDIVLVTVVLVVVVGWMIWVGVRWVVEKCWMGKKVKVQ